jgi:hypothetical protein
VREQLLNIGIEASRLFLSLKQKKESENEDKNEEKNDNETINILQSNTSSSENVDDSESSQVL